MSLPGRVLAGSGLSFHELAEMLADRIIGIKKVVYVDRVIERIVEVEKNSSRDWLEGLCMSVR